MRGNFRVYVETLGVEALSLGLRATLFFLVLPTTEGSVYDRIVPFTEFFGALVAPVFLGLRIPVPVHSRMRWVVLFSAVIGLVASTALVLLAIVSDSIDRCPPDSVDCPENLTTALAIIFSLIVVMPAFACIAPALVYGRQRDVA